MTTERNCDWDQYMGSYVTPEEYLKEGGNLKERIKADLTELWGNDSIDRLTPDEIDEIANNLSRQLERFV